MSQGKIKDAKRKLQITSLHNKVDLAPEILDAMEKTYEAAQEATTKKKCGKAGVLDLFRGGRQIAIISLIIWVSWWVQILHYI